MSASRFGPRSASREDGKDACGHVGNGSDAVDLPKQPTVGVDLRQRRGVVGEDLQTTSHHGLVIVGTIELGTSIVQTYPCHPVLMANRATATAGAMERAGFTLGIGPSHQSVIEGMYGLSYDHVGRHTEEYVAILGALLRGERVDFTGVDFRVRAAVVAPPAPIPIPVREPDPEPVYEVRTYPDPEPVTQPQPEPEEQLAGPVMPPPMPPQPGLHQQPPTGSP